GHLTMSTQESITVLVGHRDPLVAAGVAAVLRGIGRFKVSELAPALVAAELALMTGGPTVLVVGYETAMRDAREYPPSCRTLILTHLDGEMHVRSAIERGVRGYLHLGCTSEALCEGVTSLHRGDTAYSPFVTTKIAESLAHEHLTERELSVLRVM